MATVKKATVIKHTDHPAAHNKVRCPRCRLGYAVKDPNTGSMKCSRCQTPYTAKPL